MKYTSLLLAAVLSAVGLSAQAAPANNQTDYNAQIQALQNQINNLKANLKNTKQQQNDNTSQLDGLAKDKKSDKGIHVGGAVRFQYSYQDYDDTAGSGRNTDRGGDIALDTFRLNLDGSIGDVILSAEWRYYNYMTTMHHAWVGYNFNDHNQLQVGLTSIPFGVQPFDSHSFFFSSNYYLGLEDTYAFGTKYLFNMNDWNVQAAFFKNRARGIASGNAENYSYDLLYSDTHTDGGGDYDHGAGTTNTSALRVVRTFHPSDDISIEAGASGLYGQLDNGSNDPHHKLGNYGAYALHTDIDIGQLNIQAQTVRYDYRFDNDSDVMILGAYAGNYKTPTSGHTYNVNVAWSQPVAWGPITNLTFYNDYSRVTHKPGNMNDTFMNDTGVAISAGGVYAYLDWINARNQPFIGGSLAGDGEVEHRLNLNIGYYF